MKKVIAKYFIPNEENDHKPHFLREKSVMTMTTLILVLFLASMLGSYTVKNNGFLASIQSAFLVDLANEDRLEQGSSTLVINDKLVYAAELKAKDMAGKEYFAHTSPEGVTPWYWFDVAGYNYIYAGENLAVNFNRSEDVQKAWMESPLHRANILNNRYTQIGIATAEGVYKGEKTTFVVQMFGTPIKETQKAAVIESENVNVEEDTKTQETPSKDNLAQSDDLSSEVGGEAVVITEKPDSTIPGSAPIQVIAEGNTFTEIENPNYKPEPEVMAEAENSEVVVYTNWFERLIVNPAKTINKAYAVLFALILISLILKICIAIKKQHPRNIAYGVLLLVLVLIFMYINQEMFVAPVVAAA